MKCEISFMSGYGKECTSDCVWWNKCPQCGAFKPKK